MFELLDNFFMNYAQKFSEKFQKLTGKTCFFLAVVCYIIDAVLHSGAFFVELIIEKGSLLHEAISLITPLFCVIFANINYTEDKLFRKNFDGFVNMRCISLRPLRLYCSVACLIIFIPSIISDIFISHSLRSILVSVGFIFFTLAAYFASCTPLPPQKNKISEWIEAGKKAISGFFAPAPEQVPVPAKG